MKSNYQHSYKQLHYAIDTFLIHLYVLASNQLIMRSFATTLSEKGIRLLQNIEQKTIDLYEAGEKYNEAINALNRKLPPFPEANPYPFFELENESQQVSYQIVAFQEYLNQQLNRGKLSLQMQIPIFEASTFLWKKTTNFQLAPKEGMHKLSQLIKEGNHFLPTEERYPVPNPSFYTLHI